MSTELDWFDGDDVDDGPPDEDDNTMDIQFALLTCCACGYSLGDGSDVEETVRGQMHSVCAQRIWPRG